jgi:hypothetical protein
MTQPTPLALAVKAALGPMFSDALQHVAAKAERDNTPLPVDPNKLLEQLVVYFNRRHLLSESTINPPAQSPKTGTAVCSLSRAPGEECEACQ